MFRKLAIRGAAGSLLWGYHAAADLHTWSIARTPSGAWRLRARLGRVDRFQARQRGVLFAAPRPGGFWAWPVMDLEIGEAEILATLGPPEQ